MTDKILKFLFRVLPTNNLLQHTRDNSFIKHLMPRPRTRLRNRGRLLAEVYICPPIEDKNDVVSIIFQYVALE